MRYTVVRSSRSQTGVKAGVSLSQYHRTAHGKNCRTKCILMCQCELVYPEQFLSMSRSNVICGSPCPQAIYLFHSRIRLAHPLLIPQRLRHVKSHPTAQLHCTSNLLPSSGIVQIRYNLNTVQERVLAEFRPCIRPNLTANPAYASVLERNISLGGGFVPKKAHDFLVRDWSR